MFVALLGQRRALHRVAGTLLRSAQPAITDRFFDRREPLHISHFPRPGQRRDRPYGRNGHQPLDTFYQQRVALRQRRLSSPARQPRGFLGMLHVDDTHFNPRPSFENRGSKLSSTDYAYLEGGSSGVM